MAARKVELNTKEALVLRNMPQPVDGELRYVSIEDLARACFRKRGTSPDTRGNSWVRNSLRKLLRLGLVRHERSKSGRYARTALPLSMAKVMVKATKLPKEPEAATVEDRASV